MPQLDFYLTENERRQVIVYALELGCEIIPDKHYPDKNYLVATDMESYNKYCRVSPLLFILNPHYSLLPLELDILEDPLKEKRFYIKQRHGGPSIDLFAPIIGEIASDTIGPGFIGIYQFYYSKSKKIFPNEKLIQTFTLLKNFIKSISNKAELKNRTYWLGDEAVAEAKSGKISLSTISGIDILNYV